MSRYLALLALIVLLVPMAAVGQVRTIRKEVRQPLGTLMSQDEARQTAIGKAKQDALEEAGTYLESLTLVKNFQVEHDEIEALAAGVLRTRIIEEQPYMESGQFGVRVVAEIVVDGAVLSDRIQKLLQDKEQLKRLQESQDRVQQLLARVHDLEGSPGSDLSKLASQQRQAEIRESTGQLATQQWIDEAEGLWDKAKHVYYPPDIAINYLSKAIAVPRNELTWFAYWKRAQTYVWIEEYDKAVSDYQSEIDLRSGEKDSDSIIRALKSTYIDQIRSFQKINDQISEKQISTNPDNFTLAELLLKRAGDYWAWYRFDLAVRDVDRAIRLNPKLVEAYGRRAEYHHERGEYAAAVKDSSEYIRLLQAEPRTVQSRQLLATAYANRAYYHQHLERDAEAEADYTRAIELDPDHAKIFPTNFIGRGRSRATLGKYSLVIADYEQALRLDADVLWLLYDEDDPTRKPSDDDDVVQLPDLERLNYLVRQIPSKLGKPDDIDPLLRRAEAYEGQADYARAIADYGEVLNRLPELQSVLTKRGYRDTFAAVFFWRAQTFEAAGDHIGALSDLNQVVERHVNEDILSLRAKVHANLGQYDDAIADLTRATQLKPDQSAYWLRRGEAFEAMKRQDDACRDYVRACRGASVRACRVVVAKKC